MPDPAFWTTLISTSGALLGGIGGVLISHRSTLRRDLAQEEQRHRDRRLTAREETHQRMLAAAATLRVELEITCQRQWRDMDIRVLTIQQHAVSVGVEATQLAMYLPKPSATLARSLATAASALAAEVVKNTEMGHVNGPEMQYLGGFVKAAPDFREFDRILDELCTSVAPEAAPAKELEPVTQADVQRSGSRWTRRARSR
ncbi:hypothetical protein [Nonomuraea rubra]|uniref:Uncharacterized protein n=1 Tax=Nonomuraea rubra TaxID=46180 RepID=A0A7X0NPK8_9ACTN|nr:hypothetical protein [Nonomuraea rubra]MBB6547220.1 hypothetical protein [Nonomuraea rubra]